MGGYGSGFQGARKATVEDSLCLSLATLVKKKALVAGSWTRGSLKWSYEGYEPHARIGYEANLVDPDAAWLRLTYAVNGTPMDYRVRLVTTQPTYGGCRWWFLCPLARADGGPPRRVASSTCRPAGNISEADRLMVSPTPHARRATNMMGSFVVLPLRFEQTRRAGCAQAALRTAHPDQFGFVASIEEGG
jgi:hypothetical protein